MAEWRQCADFPDYEISEYGVVRRLTSCNRAPAGYVFDAGPDKDGYLRVGLRVNGRRKSRGVHQLVARAFIGPPPSPEHEVAHNDGDLRRNHFTNLRWATTLENQRDRFAHGTHNRGDMHPQAKLNAERVLEIRRQHAEGISQTELGRMHGVTKNHIGHIVHGRLWAHLPQVQANG